MVESTVDLPTKYKAEQYMKLSSTERRLFDEFIDKQITYNQSLTKVFTSQAASFQEEKEKISYERADPRYIPFLTYCWRVAAAAIGGAVVLLGAIFRLPTIEDTHIQLYTNILISMTIIMVVGLFAPLLLLPKKIKPDAELGSDEKC